MNEKINIYINKVNQIIGYNYKTNNSKEKFLELLKLHHGKLTVLERWKDLGYDGNSHQGYEPIIHLVIEDESSIITIDHDVLLTLNINPYSLSRVMNVEERSKTP